MTQWSANEFVAARLLNAEHRPALIAQGEGDGALTLELQSRFYKPIGLLTPEKNPRQGYHIALSFRPGVLSTSAIERLAGPNTDLDILQEARSDWTIGFRRPGRGEVVTIYLLCTGLHTPARLIERTDAIMDRSARPSFPPLVLHGLTAHPELVGRGTQVQVAFSPLARFEGTQMMHPSPVSVKMFVAHAARAPAQSGTPTTPPLQLSVGGSGAVNPKHDKTAPTHFFLKNTSSTETIEAKEITFAVNIGEMTPETADYLCDQQLFLQRSDRPALSLWLDDKGPHGCWTALEFEHIGDQAAPRGLRWAIPLPRGRLDPNQSIALRFVAESSSVSDSRTTFYGPLGVELRYDWAGYGVGSLSFQFPRHSFFNDLFLRASLNYDRSLGAEKKAENALQGAMWSLNEAAEEPEIFGLPSPSFHTQPPRSVLDDPPKLRYRFYVEDGKVRCRPTLSGKYFFEHDELDRLYRFNVKERYAEFIDFGKELWFINQTLSPSNTITRIHVSMKPKGEHNLRELHLQVVTDKPLREVVDLRVGGGLPL